VSSDGFCAVEEANLFEYIARTMYSNDGAYVVTFARPNVPNIPTIPSIPERHTRFNPTLQLSHPSGMYDTAFDLTITATNTQDIEYDIYFTFDSTNPRTSDTRVRFSNSITVHDRTNDDNIWSAVDSRLQTPRMYRGPNYHVNVSPTARNPLVEKLFPLRAVAIARESGEVSQEVNASFFVGETARQMRESNMAIISIITDPENLFDHYAGIYVNGWWFEHGGPTDTNNPPPNEFGQGWANGNFRQKGRAWERPVHIDFFESGGEHIFSQRCGMRIQGGYSRSQIQKGLRFFPRNEYQAGVDNRFHHEFFPHSTNVNGDPITSYRRIIARAGGNGTFWNKWEDTAQQSFFDNRAISTKATRPVMVFLLGEYWGLYVLQEDYTADFFADHYLVNANNVIVVKGTCHYVPDVDDGRPEDIELYNQMHEWFRTANLATAADFERATRYFCLDSFVDYFAALIYNENVDWPGKNYVIWRTREVESGSEFGDARWRWATIDFDLAGNPWGIRPYYSNRVADLWGNGNQAHTNHLTRFFRAFMHNQYFRERLANTLLEYANYELAWSHVSSEFDRFAELYSRAELERSFRRFPVSSWYGTMGPPTVRRNELNIFYQNRPNFVRSVLVPWINNPVNFI